MAMLEHDYEPTPGMPQALPEGERVLWQGPAQFRRVALSTFHVRKLAVYFGALIMASVAYDIATGADAAAMTASAATFALLAAIALGLLTLYARLVAKATMYTVTNRRVVMRTGVAVPVTVNLPFSRIERAALRTHDDDTGEIAIVPDGSGRASYVLLWPLVKPFRWLRVQPVMRGVEDASHVAGILAEQLSLQAATAPEPDTAKEPPKPEAKSAGWTFRPYPTIPMAAAASLVVFALVAVTWGQLSDVPTPPGAESRPEPVAAVSLFFDDRDDGSVVVTEADSGVVLDVLEPGSNGFLRGAMRTLVGARRASDMGRETPFLLEQMPNGQLLLSDPATHRYIDLRAFGPTNAEAFGRFIELAANADDGANHAMSNETQPSATAVALSNQEVNP